MYAGQTYGYIRYMIFKEVTDIIPPYLSPVRLDRQNSLSLSQYHQICSTTPVTLAYINTGKHRCLPLPTLKTNTAWPWFHFCCPGKNCYFFSQQPLHPFSRSNDTDPCPVTYITLASCRTKNTMSRLMSGLCFTENFSHLFTVKLWQIWDGNSKPSLAT